MQRLFCLTAAALLSMGAASAHEVVHAGHEHEHAKDCRHQAVAHAGHVDYLHDGHLHHGHDSHADEHVVSVSATNPVAETLISTVDADKRHGEEGHKHTSVPHGDHFDCLHDGRLHAEHDGHVDDHGPLQLTDA